jgi:hypothetical protein
MKKITGLLLFLFLITEFIHAQTNLIKNNPSEHFDFIKANNVYVSNITFKHKLIPPYGERGKAYYQEKLRKAKSMRIAGIVMSCLGGGAIAGTISGSIALARNRNQYNSNIGYYNYNNNIVKIYALAFGGAVLSGGLIGAGIPLAVVGSSRVKKYKNTIATEF